MPENLQWASSILDPPGSVVVGVLWHVGGSFEAVLAYPARSVSAAVDAHGRLLLAAYEEA